MSENFIDTKKHEINDKPTQEGQEVKLQNQYMK